MTLFASPVKRLSRANCVMDRLPREGTPSWLTTMVLTVVPGQMRRKASLTMKAQYALRCAMYSSVNRFFPGCAACQAATIAASRPVRSASMAAVWGKLFQVSLENSERTSQPSGSGPIE
jgi:hypothetical protein